MMPICMAVPDATPGMSAVEAAATPTAPPIAVTDTPVYRLLGYWLATASEGPAIIETPVTTIVVQPKQTAAVDGYLNVVIEVPPRSASL